MSVLLRHVQGARRGSPRRLRPAGLALIAMLTAGALSLLIGPAFGAKVVLGTVGTPGSGAGQFNPQGVQGAAVNNDGVGGADPGDLYVVDGRNYRIDQFHADGGFVRAFGWGVKQGDAAPYALDVCTDATGCQAGQPGNGEGQLGQDAIKAAGIAIDQATGAIYVTDQSNERVEIFSATGQFEGAFGRDVVASGPDNVTPPVFNEQQSVTLNAVLGTITGGTFTLTFDGQTTMPIAYDASGSAVDSALEALTNIGSGNVAVTGSAGGPWSVEFTGGLAGTSVSQITGNATGTTGGVFPRVTVTTTTQGGARPTFESCVPAAGDICQAGQSGEGAGEFSDSLTSVAVDPSTADGYVADADNSRIEEFKPNFSGNDVTGVSFVKALGWDVVPSGAPGDTGTGFESCTTASTCQSGASGTGAGQFVGGSLGSIALDSGGAIFAVGITNPGASCRAAAPCRVQKLTPDSSASSGYSAADFAPDVLTQTGGSKYKVAAFELAVDPANDHLFVAQAQGGTVNNVFGVKEFSTSGSGSLLDTSPPGAGISGAAKGLAVGPAGAVYFVNGSINVLGPVPAPSATILPATNVGKTTATFNGTVTPPVGGYDTTYHFEYSLDGVTWKRWPDHEVDAGSDHKPATVHQDVTGLEPNAAYEVRVVATTGTPYTSSTATFSTGASAPSISGTTALSVKKESAKLTAYVNPNNSPTTYHFEWGAGTSYGHEVPSFELFAGAGGKPVRVSASISGLTPNATYHFRVVATNASSGVTAGPDQTFATLNDAGLPDNRRYELVSPSDKGATGLAGTYLGNQLISQVAADGQSFVYPLAFGLPDAGAGGDTRYLAQRTPSGWQSTELTPPAITPPVSAGDGNSTGIYSYFSDDLSCGVVESGQPLSADAPPAVIDGGGKNLYRRNADGSFTVLSSLSPTNPDYTNLNGAYYAIDGASTDCNHVVFETSYEYPGVGASGLYEWDNGQLRNVGVLPDGSVAASAQVGWQSGGNNVWHAVSADGSRIFFRAISDEGGDSGHPALFVREDASTTVDVSQSRTATVDRGAAYQVASTGGDRVLFLANYGLTADSSAGPTNANCASAAQPPKACDLYEAAYDHASGQWTLSDLSADSNPADTSGATVAGVLGASDDASYVYFAAQGQLVPSKGSTYAQNVPAATYNVYLAHNGALSFVGAVGQDDLRPGAGGSHDGVLIGDSAGGLADWAVRVTPDGHNMLFPSTVNVTGYDSGGVAEAYLYSTESGTAVCVSCRQDGLPSVGDEHTQPLPVGGHLFLNAFHPPRSLTADGARVFFTMPDVLAAGAVSGEDNIYEWEHGQVYLLATTGQNLQLRGASADGNDVFIQTYSRLVSQDRDDTLDIYDIRVDGGFPAAQQPTVCAPLSGACQAAGPSSPVFGPIGSVSVAGAGNVSPPPAPSGKKRSKGSKLRVRALTRRQRRRLARGRRIGLRVRVPQSGTVRAVAHARLHQRGGGSRVHRVVQATKHVRSAGAIRLRIRLSKRARRYSRAHKRLRITLKVSYSKAKRARRMKFTLHDRRHRSTDRIRARRSTMTARHNQPTSYDRGGAK